MDCSRNMFWFLAILLVSLACAGSSGTGQSDGGLRKNVVVQINEMHVQPQVVRVPANGNSIAWTNWTRSIATVSFAASVADSFTCKETRPDFVVNGPRLESIEELGSNEDLVTPCPLKPGNYAYEVYLFDNMGNRENPRLKLSGTIVVVQ